MGYIVFAVVMLICVIVFVLLWRSRKSKKAQALGDVIKDQPSAESKDLLDLWLDDH